MNIIADFITRVNNLYPEIDNEELSSLMTTIKNQEDELQRKDKEIEKLRQTLEHLKKEAPKKESTRKSAVPKK